MARVKLNLNKLSITEKTAKGRQIVPVPNARSYTIEASLDPATATTWVHAGIATSASKVVSNLKSGTRYWFRVAAVGVVGQSGWSEHATKIAP